MYKSREKRLPSPTYMSEDQMATYLKDLRTQRLSRPSGSRPAPPSKFGSLRRMETAPPEPSVQSRDDRPTLPSSNSMPTIPAQSRTLTHRRADSDLRIRSPFAGRPLARPPSATPEPESAKDGAATQRPMSVPYLENGMRWMEKQEARSLRMALEDMDLEEEKKIHTAAQDEAAELVWRHQNPDAALANPDAPKANPDLAKSGAEVKRDYREHMRRGSYARSHSRETAPLAESRKAPGDRKVSVDIPSIAKRGSTPTFDGTRKISPPTGSIASRKGRTPSGKSYGGLAEAVEKDIAVAFRRTSGGNKRIMSGDKKMYMHRNDRIWEDPQEHSSPPAHQILESMPEPVKPAATPIQPPSFVRKNPFARVRMQSQARMLEHSTSAPVLPVAKRESVEIQRNPPSQSRNAFYTSNPISLPPTPPTSRDEPTVTGTEDDVSPKATPTKNGKEIRSEELRAATGKLRKDRSPNLPQPTAVSEKAGRPIVSFKKDWGPKEVVLAEVRSTEVPEPAESTKSIIGGSSRPLPRVAGDETPTKRPLPHIVASDPGARTPIPTIIVPDDSDVPTVVLPEEPDFADTVPALGALPTFNISPPAPKNKINPPPTFSFPPPATNAPTRPLPTRPAPLHHAATSPLPQKSSPHSTPYSRQSSVLCAHCALPIAGRILSAAGARFHPQCFTCHSCNTNLELVAFYPEPENKRSERLARIAARQNGEDIPIPDGVPPQEALEYFQRQEVEDGDGSLRFYCHLDFHEHFSPRCKTCKTPIEGEVIVACGAEYHSGHFFCAQCGDPFDARTPFVEKDGWAWCVGCHTKRYNSKCRGCRKPVEGVVVKALGADWCDGCFVCVECKGDFEDGRYFLRGDSQDPVCVRCEERRLKA